jgi:hypothetical protein
MMLPLQNMFAGDTPAPPQSYVLKGALLIELVLLVLQFVLVGTQGLAFNLLNTLLVCLTLLVGWMMLSLRVVSFYWLYCIVYGIWYALTLSTAASNFASTPHFTLVQPKKDPSLLIFCCLELVYRLAISFLLPYVFSVYEDYKI